MVKGLHFKKNTILWVSFFVLLVAIRVILEPKRAPPNEISLTPQNREQVRIQINASFLDRSALLANLAKKRVILVGESHFIKEPQEWLQGLLDDLHAKDGRPTVLLMELPSGSQANLDHFMAAGNESDLKSAFGRATLPFQSTVRWARSHPKAVARVIACDENQWHIGLMRFLMTDTRNDSMAQAVVREFRRMSDSRIVVYGGALHMMKSGRYMYDSDTRRPIGQRLPALGISSVDLAAVWLFAGDSPVDGAWSTPGTLDLAGPAGNIPLKDVETEKIFNATAFKDIVDYAIYLGPSTPIDKH